MFASSVCGRFLTTVMTRTCITSSARSNFFPVRSHCEMYPNIELDGPALLKDLKEVVLHARAGENSISECVHGTLKVVCRNRHDRPVAFAL